MKTKTLLPVPVNTAIFERVGNVIQKLREGHTQARSLVLGIEFLEWLFLLVQKAENISSELACWLSQPQDNFCGSL